MFGRLQYLRFLREHLRLEIRHARFCLIYLGICEIDGRDVVGKGPLRCFLVDQLDLVDHDPGLKRVPFCDHQKPVEHSAVRLRLCRGEDDDDLIHVGGYDALALPCSRFAPRQF